MYYQSILINLDIERSIRYIDMKVFPNWRLVVKNAFAIFMNLTWKGFQGIHSGILHKKRNFYFDGGDWRSSAEFYELSHL